MKDIVERLYDLSERFIFQGGSEFARSLADEIMALRTKAGNWEKVFGHLGTPDEVGNEWIALKDEVEALRGSLEEWKLDLNSLRDENGKLLGLLGACRDNLGGHWGDTELSVEAVGRPDAVPARVKEAFDSLRDENAKLSALLLWALYHHQGGSSEVGQPIRRALGDEQMNKET